MNINSPQDDVSVLLQRCQNGDAATREGLFVAVLETSTAGIVALITLVGCRRRISQLHAAVSSNQSFAQ